MGLTVTMNCNCNILLGRTGLPTAGSVAVKKKKKFGPSRKGGPVTDICVMSKTVSCRVAWGWSVRVNLYNRQIMIPPEKAQIYAT